METSYADSPMGLIENGLLQAGVCYLYDESGGGRKREIVLTGNTPVTVNGDLVCEATDGAGVAFSSAFSFDAATGVVKRRDSIKNESKNDVTIVCPGIFFRLAAAGGKIRIVNSKWCAESQYEWITAEKTARVIGARGRSCSDYAPHFALVSGDRELVFNLLPCGDWRAAFSAETDTAGDTAVHVSIDSYEDELNVHLKPGEVFTFRPECLLQFECADTARTAGWKLQLYVRSNLEKRKFESLPVVYNTWFDRFYRISVEGLTEQLRAAARVGCEVFVIDAGWFGDYAEDWAHVGDWRENRAVFDETTVAGFADIVREHGLEFGIWMEPERLYANAPVREKHREWFIEGKNNCYYPDLMQPQARQWMVREMQRIIESYGVKWIKIDCNFDFSPDPYKQGHRGRISAWHEVLDELNERFPDLVMENCAAGGLRTDLLTAGHYHTNFISDTVDPMDVINITMSTFCRLGPSMMAKWAVIYPSGGGFTPYGNAPGDTGDLVLIPCDAACRKMASHHIEFPLRAAMTGVMGIGGNIAGLPAKLQCRLADHIGFYKKERHFIANSVAVPLTPVRNIDERNEQAAVQLSDAEFLRNLIFIYNIASEKEYVEIWPYNTDAQARYSAADEEGNAILSDASGKKLIEEGLRVDCPKGSARVIELARH